MNVDVTSQIGAVTREVGEREHEGKTRRVVAATRTYATSPEDVWDAITQPERLARWFGTVSGDLRLGGRFKTKDAASGKVTACRPPHMLGVTWEAWGDVSWVEVQLSPAPNGGTLLKVEHILSKRFFDWLHWSWFGAGATGVGWELWLLGLDQYVSTGTRLDLKGWPASSEGKDFLKQASSDWCRAEVVAGERSAKANKRAARAFAFYSRRPAH